MTPVLTDTARVLVTSTSSDGIVVKVPGTQYQLSFLPHCPKCSFVAGERVHARFRATALKMHHAKAGGIFVEPSEGHARIVQGRVIATDTRSNMVLADVVVPMWIAVPQGQAASDFATGDLLNFYVQSGSTIEPVR
ncbi:MAG: hypothetical protein RL527_583 [Planctomycetota bacterium]|jgi:hypothetical protein